MIVALVVAWLVLFLPQLSGRVFVLGDAPLYRGYGDFSYQRWTELHQRTFWNPYVFFGIASATSLADPRPQWLPDGLLTLWDALTRGPNGWLLGPPLLAHLAGMLAIAALARRLWRCGPAAMVTAGLVWGVAPNLIVPFALGHDAQMIATGLIPVLLWTLDGALGAGSRRRAFAWALGMAVTLALQVLGGHPQFVVYGLIALAALAVLRRGTAASRSRFALAAGAVGMGLLMSAALWWPAWLYMGDTHRGEVRFAVLNAQDFSLAFRDLLALGWPRAVGWGGAGYWGGQRATDYANTLGGIGLLLAVWGALAAPRGPRRALARGVAGFAAVAVVFALGPNLPGIGSWLLHLPVISAFRTPSTWMVLTQLAGALLAALGFDRLLGAAARRAGVVRAAGAAVLLAGGLVALARPSVELVWRDAANGGFRTRVADGILTADENERTFARVLPDASRAAVEDLVVHLVGLGAFALAISWRASRGASRVAFAATALITLIDLGSVSVPAARGSTGPRRALTPGPGPPFVRAASRDSLHRAYPLDVELFFSNHWIAWRARSVAGLHGAVPRQWGEVRQNNLLLWDGFVRAVAVRYVGGVEYSIQDSTGYDVTGGVMSRRDALPRAYTVPRVVAVAHDSFAVQRMARLDFDPTRVAYTTDSGAAGEYPGSPGAAIAWTRDQPDSIDLTIRAAAPAFVVIADSWFRGWSATLDGAPVPIARVSHVLRGIAVPAGEHRIAMRYRPAGWDAGRAVSLAAWAVWLITAAAAAVGLAAARRSRAATPLAAGGARLP